MDTRQKAPAQADRPIPELIQNLASETTTLVRQEVALARAEIAQTLGKARGAAPSFGVAAVLAVGTFAALTVTLIAALALVLPLWAAALIVTVVYALVAFFAVQRGRKTLQAAGSPVPVQTLQTLAGDVEAARTGFQRGR